MKCVIISEEKIIDLGKRCLSNLRDFVNNEYNLEFNDVKRLRTLFFLACQKVVGEQQKSKENLYVFEEFNLNLENLNLENLNLENLNLKNLNIKNKNEVWNEKLDEKFCEAVKYTKKSKVGNDESEVEEVFNTPVCDIYSREKFSLEETDRIFILVEDGLDRCQEINEDLYYEIKDFKKYIVFIIVVIKD